MRIQAYAVLIVLPLWRHASSTQLRQKHLKPKPAAFLPPVKATRPTDFSPKQLQLYHISKCGGTTLRTLFESDELFTTSARGCYIGQQENRCDPKNCLRKPDDVFIIANIRNPFEFYVSYWQMILLQDDPWQYDKCVGPVAQRDQMLDVYNTSYMNNATTFGRWLDLLLQDRNLGGSCIEGSQMVPKGMSGIYNKMMLDADGYEVFDALVRLENFYPTLRRALKKYEKFAPSSINWHYFDGAEKQNLHANGGLPFKSSYSCLYTESSRRLVERYDRALLEQYNYAFEQMEPCSTPLA